MESLSGRYLPNHDWNLAEQDWYCYKPNFVLMMASPVEHKTFDRIIADQSYSQLIILAQQQNACFSFQHHFQKIKD